MKDANMNLPNQIYEDWIKETNTLKIKIAIKKMEKGK